MKRLRKLITVTAVVVMVLVLAPAATADDHAPLRATGSAYFDGNGWASAVSGDLDCTGYELSDVRIVGREPLVIGTMHWLGTTVLTCGDGTITIEGNGAWSFANSKWVQPGVVTAATGAYTHLVGARTLLSGTVDMSQFPTALTTTMFLRIN